MRDPKVLVVLICSIAAAVMALIVGMTLTIVIGHVDPAEYLDFLSGGAIASILGAITVSILTVSGARLKRVEKQTNGTTSALVAHNVALTNQLVESGGATSEPAQVVADTAAPAELPPPRHATPDPEPAQIHVDPTAVIPGPPIPGSPG